MTLDELYKLKGEAVTQIEVWQARLQNYNQQIIEILNKQAIAKTEDSAKVVEAA